MALDMFDFGNVQEKDVFVGTRAELRQYLTLTYPKIWGKSFYTSPSERDAAAKNNRAPQPIDVVDFGFQCAAPDALARAVSNMILNTYNREFQWQPNVKKSRVSHL